MFWPSVLTVSTFEIGSFFIVIMSILESQLIVEQVYKEFNSLADKIAAKYEQLDSGEFGAVGSPAFNAKSTELSFLFLA